MRTLRLLPLGLLLVLAIAPCPAGAAPSEDGYLVLTGFDEQDAFHAAATRLAKHRSAAIVPFDPDAPDAVLDTLRRHRPRYVAFVMRPEQIHVNSVRAILRLATQVDDDPFVDFDYGYVTGATAEEADRFVQNLIRATKQALPKRIGQSAVWGGQGPSHARDEVYRVGSLSFPSRSLRFRSPSEGHGRDLAFLEKELPSLEGAGAILMGGHGGPTEIVSGPRAEDLDRLDLFPCVAVSYACYTGVTNVYPERTFGRGTIGDVLKSVEPGKSFALTLLRRGVVGYVGYVNPRPAGPEMSIDFQRILTGETLGSVRRRDYAKVCLGYLGFGESGIVPPRVVDGASRPRAAVDSVRHMMLDGATGGILFGDPAYRPFPEAPGELPLTTEVEGTKDALLVRVRLRAQDAYLWGADPFRRFTDKPPEMAMKLYDRVEVPDGFGPIRSVRVEKATWGGKPIDTLPVVWAEERDRGRRYLHVKAGFARGGRGEIDIQLVTSPEAPPPEPATTAEEEKPRGVVWELNQALLGGARLDAEATAKIRSLGAEGFPAVLSEIRAGRGHYRTHELVALTKQPGSEKALMLLAAGPDLANHGHWVVLESLGHFDEPDVRAWLLAYLGRTKDAGRFMATAKALARLKEAGAVEPIATQLLRFEPGWSGVEWHLVHALGGLGGDAVAGHLETFVLDERATREVGVGYALDHLARLDPARAAKAAKALTETQRYEAFSDRAKAYLARYVERGPGTPR